MSQTITIPLYDDQTNKIGSTQLNPDWIIHEKGLPFEAIQFAEAFGKHLAALFKNRKGRIISGRDSLSTTQLRNFFSEIRRIQVKKDFEENPSDFFMLKPKLRYAAARVLSNQRYNRIKDFVDVLTVLIDKVSETKKEAHFQNFTKFVEAVVAYHKWYGGE